VIHTLGGVTQSVFFTAWNRDRHRRGGHADGQRHQCRQRHQLHDRPQHRHALVGATTGLVSVDGFETIEFANKTNLVINSWPAATPSTSTRWACRQA
jgi:hypothetical protein